MAEMGGIDPSRPTSKNEANCDTMQTLNTVAPRGCVREGGTGLRAETLPGERPPVHGDRLGSLLPDRIVGWARMPLSSSDGPEVAHRGEKVGGRPLVSPSKQQ